MGFVVVFEGGGPGSSEVVEGGEDALEVNDVVKVAEAGGASRLVVGGQVKPAEDASRLFSIGPSKSILNIY